MPPCDVWRQADLHNRARRATRPQSPRHGCRAVAQNVAVPDASVDIPPSKHITIVRDFLPNAAALRETFDENFSDSRRVHDARFCWDYWHLPGQYTQLRTPAQDYFEKEDYARLESSLLDFGKEKLGCIGVTPIWLSYYIDGCRQELHCDNVHGPWAFVLSLTDWHSRRFVGGETMLLKDAALNFWSNFSTDTVIEQDSLMELVPPRFNQLTCFDPRIPHGVKEVRGVQDPVYSRIVLHGWFVEPELFVEGDISFDEAKEGFQNCMAVLTAELDSLPEMTGTLVLRLTVGATGAVDDIAVLTDTLVPRPWDVTDNEPKVAHGRVLRAATSAFRAHTFSPRSEKATITAPLMFE